MPLIIPNTFVAGQKAKAAEVNENFETISDFVTAGIGLSDLADGTSGQLIVCDASGHPQYVTPSGDVDVSNAGAFQITPQVTFDVQSADQPTQGLIPGLETSALAAGTWWFFVRIEVESGAGGNIPVTTFQLEKDATTAFAVGKAFCENANEVGLCVLLGQMSSNGTNTVRVTLSDPAALINGTSTRGAMLGIRIG